jgi:hypothetical protein
MTGRPQSKPARNVPAGMSRLSVTAAAPVGRGRALALLGGSERQAWLGEMVETAVAGTDRDRYLVDLELRISDHAPRLAFRKAAFVEVGPVSAPETEPIRLEISWRAAGLAPLFPVFSGSLCWSAGELHLDGLYAPPGGGIGMVADRVLLNVAARGTARLLLERIAAAMRGELT